MVRLKATLPIPAEANAGSVDNLATAEQIALEGGCVPLREATHVPRTPIDPVDVPVLNTYTSGMVWSRAVTVNDWRALARCEVLVSQTTRKALTLPRLMKIRLHLQAEDG